MNTATNNAARLTNADILATCGDADCATSDAEMTAADHAAYALVVAEVAAEQAAAAPVALTYEECAALADGARVVRMSTGKAYVKHVDGNRPGQFYFQIERSGKAFGRGYGFRAGRFALAA